MVSMDRDYLNMSLVWKSKFICIVHTRVFRANVILLT